MAKTSELHVATISGPHGLDGALRVTLHNPESSALAARRKISIRMAPLSETSPREDSHVVERVRLIPRSKHQTTTHVVMVLAGVNSREQADRFAGAEIYVARQDLPRLAKGEFYHVDLVGLPVVDNAGSKLGAVREVFRYPTVDVLVIEGEAALEVPLTPRYCERIDLEEGIIVLQNLDELS